MPYYSFKFYLSNLFIGFDGGSGIGPVNEWFSYTLLIAAFRRSYMKVGEKRR